jgi:outer membrane immunogenic protein
MHNKLFFATAAALALTGPALAAEPLPPPPPPPVFTWTGPYIGGQIGGAWGPSTFDLLGFNPRTSALFAISDGSSQSGVIGGGHVGY